MLTHDPIVDKLRVMDKGRDPREIFNKFRTFVWLSPMKGTYGVYYLQPSEMLSMGLKDRAGSLQDGVRLLGRTLAVGLTAAMRSTPTPVFGVAYGDGMVVLYRKIEFDVERVGAILASSMGAAMSPLLGAQVSFASEFFEFPSSEILARFLKWHEGRSIEHTARFLAPLGDSLGIDASPEALEGELGGWPAWVRGGIMEYWALVSGKWELRMKEGGPVGPDLRTFVMKAL